ncbi:hypothetical protein BKA63DRAFT_473262 [Paraphoma chrysanthemicola]|nr:hypothetical protein BKA63DRAFT_473262 [Paraphoma chrysanthemicola]
MHSSPATVSFSSAFQYAFFAVVVYVLAGAPLSSIISDSYSGRSGTDVSAQSVAQEKIDSLVIPDAELTCGEHTYKGVHVLSRQPLVVYVEGFLSEEEAKHAVGVSEPHFTPSTVWNAGQETLNTKVRHSEKAQLPRDQTVKCIEDRARQFQGWRPYVFIEKLWAQRYGIGGHYTYHYDWSTATRTSGRISSFMVYLEANCTGGGTHFPRLQHPSPESDKHQWCRFIECGANADETADPKLSDGITFKPIAGNAVYWENMRPDGSGYPESWHAGLPVKSGTKIGLNIWSWLQVGYEPHGDNIAEQKE